MDTEYTLTNPATLLYPDQLFEPKAFKDPKTGAEKGEPLYGTTFLFDPANPDWKAMKQHALRVAQAEYPGIKWGEFTTPFKNGTELADKRKAENAALVAAGKKPKAEQENMRGKGVMQVRSKFPIALSGVENGSVVDYTNDAAIARAKAKFFSGAEVLAQLNFVAGDVRGKYVTAYGNLVMVTGKGTKIGGSRANGSAVFAGYKGSVSAENPLVDDEIPY